MHVRLARRIDAPRLAMIYNQGVEDRVATFETRLREYVVIVEKLLPVHLY